MPDRDNVIKAVECRKNAHKRCANPCERTGGCVYARWIRGLDGEPYYPCACDVERLCDDVIAMLKEQETGGWISVEDKLPDSKEQVLIVFEWTGISGTKYREIALDSFKAMGYLGYKPLFWMPLPEPPEEDENEKAAD